ncbi:MAG: 50S ribosomal protein L24 [Candidatus Omnitrophica bacterium]|nr:50S ribosomal protein L24 [Candidatus Omnitrophota bacterium]
MKIRRDDQVIVVRGKDKGKKGRVMRVYPKEQMVLVEKINYRTVYLRKSQENPKGGITKMEGKLHISNVKLLCPRSGKPSRVGYTVLADGTKHRTVKASGEVL